MEFNIIIEKGEDGYLISEVIGLLGCRTQGRTMEELLANTREAISLYLKVTRQKRIRDKFIGVNLDKKLIDLKKEFQEKLRGKIQSTEVALSIASGDGKEHMALISALINLPVGIRFAALTKDGVVDL